LTGKMNESTLNDHPTFYDVLDLKPDASSQEIREAYLRSKSAYSRDSVALYSLINTEEREDMLRLIEEAYQILSSPERRKEYDRYHGLLSAEADMISRHRPSSHDKIISIDRVPPMETRPDSDDLLVPPTTDFTTELQQPNEDVFSESATPSRSATPPPAPPPRPPKSESSMAPSLAQEIAQEIEWTGLFLRKVRESRRVSIEELAEITKIRKTYIVAIEEEIFAKLPASVFLRGFVMQIARVLKLPHENVASAYMVRVNRARPDQSR
jgi:DNA-binding XRE family transcriptional regulator